MISSSFPKKEGDEQKGKELLVSGWRGAERLQPKRRDTVLRREYLVGDDPVRRLRVVEPVPADAPAAVGARRHLGAPARRLPGPVVVRRAAAAAARHERLTETCSIKAGGGKPDESL